MITDEQRVTATQLAQHEFRIVVQSGYNEDPSTSTHWRAIWTAWDGEEFIEYYDNTKADAVQGLRDGIAKLFANLMGEGWTLTPPGKHNIDDWRKLAMRMVGDRKKSRSEVRYWQKEYEDLLIRFKALESGDDDIELVDNAIHGRLTGHIVSSHIADTPPGFEGDDDQ